MPISSECYAKKHGGGHNALNINTQAFSIRHCNNHKSVYRQAIYSYHGGCAFVPNDYSRINAKVIISFHIIKVFVIRIPFK